MDTATPSIDTIFGAAIEISSDDDRAAYLARMCRDGAILRQHVEILVDAHFQRKSFMETPVAEAHTPINETMHEGPDTVIGPYKLLEQIGEGGFGVVFMAQQQQP